MNILTKLNVSVALRTSTSHLILIDTGSSAHIFRDKSYFISFDKDFDPESVRIILADGSESKNITAKGTVSITLNTTTGSQKQVTLKNAYLLPDLNHMGIISVKCGIQEGHAYHFAPEHSYVRIDTDKCPFESKENSDLFYINVHANRVKSTVARSMYDWHKIMGHLSYESIAKMPMVADGMTIKNKSKKTHVKSVF